MGKDKRSGMSCVKKKVFPEEGRRGEGKEKWCVGRGARGGDGGVFMFQWGWIG